MLKKAVIFLVLILWPLNLILNHDFPKTGVPRIILENDYQAEQLILRNIHLYPNIPMARTFQNKARIYFNKFADNFFALTDLNNYFFGFHPRPIVPDNKNLFKFPFMAIVFFLYGVFSFEKYKYKKIVLLISTLLVFGLSLLKNFDGYDFVLWIPISLVIIHGISTLQKDSKKLFTVISLIFIIFAIPEIIRSFIR